VLLGQWLLTVTKHSSIEKRAEDVDSFLSKTP